MKEFWVDFNGSILIGGENEEEVKKTFWDFVAEQEIKYCEISDVEERTEV